MTPNIPHVAYYLAVPAYLAIGAAIGIILKYHLARHLWVEHNLTQRPTYGSGVDCWCREICPGGDFVFATPYLSVFLWPIIVAVMVVSTPFRIYGKILDHVAKLASRDQVADEARHRHIMLQEAHNLLLARCQELEERLNKEEEALAEYKKAQGAPPPCIQSPHIETTVEEEFKKRTGRELGGDAR